MKINFEITQEDYIKFNYGPYYSRRCLDEESDKELIKKLKEIG